MNAEETLRHHGIRPTPVRIKTLQALRHQTETFTLADVEGWMPDTDKSTIFRTLQIFSEHQLLHTIDDGSGCTKYCVCRCEDHNHPGHLHFACTKCGKTYCIEDEAIPRVQLPAGFTTHEVEYIIKGICINCNNK